MRSLLPLAAVLTLPLPHAAVAAPASLPADKIEFFESKIRPVLASACYDCHGPEKQKAGLRLDWRDALLKGGEHGPALIPGDPAKSLLLQAIAHTHPEIRMPKNADPLPPATVASFRQWIADGAPDPRDKPATETAGDWPAAFALRKQWWCWQPLKAVEPPTIPGVENPIDRFLVAEMQKHGLSPAPPADPATVARRLSYTLTGLPPSQAEVAVLPTGQIVNHKSQIVNLTNRLLSTPQYGERWARHWMDWLRYADSHGSEGDPAIPCAYQYRDYLIRALNADVPYPQLVKEHLAGDLITPRFNPDATINESAIGPAHLRMVFHGFTPTDALDEFVTFTDNQVDVVSKAFLGLTVSCARCHNHKFDAISQEDYYAMFGVFANTRPATVDVHNAGAEKAVRERMKALQVEILDAIKKDWRAAGEVIRQRFIAWQPANEEQRREAEGNGHGPLAAWLAMCDVPPDNFAEKWAAVAAAAEDWEKKRVAWAEAARRSGRAQWYMDSGNLSWTTRGYGLEHPADRQHITLFPEGEKVISGTLPRGFASAVLSERDPAVMTSSPFKAEGGRLWVQVSGRGSGVRCVVQNYPRSGLIFPKSEINFGQLRWLSFDLEYWKGESIHLEAWTGPDAPIETGGGERSSFTLSQVAYPKDEKLTPPEPGVPVQFIHHSRKAVPVPQNRDDVLKLYSHLFEGYGLGGCPPEGGDFNNFFVRSGIMPNTLKELPTAAPLVEEYRKLEASLKPPVRAPGVMEGGPGDWPLYIRGDHKKPGPAVPRHFLSALDATPFQTTGSGRRELADAITGPGGALASRVIVNRLWHHVFGRGLVATPDNFGKLGDLPTHPELLDWLAAEFQRRGGSIKSMLELMVTSAAFSAQAAPSPEAAAKDPENKLLSHWTLRRMEAEAIRDSILSVSGKLDRTSAGGPAVPGATPRRSVYVSVIRNNLDPFLTAFDAPVPSSTRGKRDATNVPAQALTLMNAPLVQGWANDWAARVAKATPVRESQIRQLYREAFQRDPSVEEVTQCLAFMDETAAGAGKAAAEIAALQKQLSERQQAMDALTAPVIAKLKTAPAPNAPAAVKPLAEWTFENSDAARAGTMPLELHGNARIANGALQLDGQDSFVSTAPLPSPLRAKTLEAWVSLTTLDQSGGGILTIQDLQGETFDAIVFAEKDPRQWVAGSNFFARTQSANGPVEPEATQRPVHIAITWSDDGTIRLYRDGQPYGQPYKTTGPVTFNAGASQILLGNRHGPPGGNRLLTGAIHRARLYDRALTAEEIAATASLEGPVVTEKTILTALSVEDRARHAALTANISLLQSSLNNLRATAAPVDPLQSLALALINMKEFIYLR